MKKPKDLSRTHPLMNASIGPLLGILLVWLLDLPVHNLLPNLDPALAKFICGSLVGLLPGSLFFAQSLRQNKLAERVESIYYSDSELSPEEELRELTGVMASLVQPDVYTTYIGVAGGGCLVLLSIGIGVYYGQHLQASLTSFSLAGQILRLLLLTLIVLVLAYAGCKVTGSYLRHSKFIEPIRISSVSLHQLVKDKDYKQASKSLALLENESVNSYFDRVVKRGRKLCRKIIEHQHEHSPSTSEE